MSGWWALVVVLILPFALGAGALWLDRVFRDDEARPRLQEGEIAEDVTSR